MLDPVTKEHSVSVARLTNTQLYLKMVKQGMWYLFDEVPKPPYYIVNGDGEIEEVKSI